MTKVNQQSIKQDLSVLAIQAAEELTRYKKGFDTEFQSFRQLISILESSEKINDDNSNYRLDHDSVITSAISISLPHKTKSDIINEALKIGLNKSTSEANLDSLISFLVALSDSAALYNEELEELRKHFA